MITMKAEDVVASFSDLLDQVSKNHEEVLITVHGEVVAKIVENCRENISVEDQDHRFSSLPEDYQVSCSDEEITSPVYPNGFPISE